MREVVSGLSRVLRQPFCLLLPTILDALASWVSSISIESLVTGKYSLLLSTGRVLGLVKLNRTSVMVPTRHRERITAQSAL